VDEFHRYYVSIQSSVFSYAWNVSKTEFPGKPACLSVQQFLCQFYLNHIHIHMAEL